MGRIVGGFAMSHVLGAPAGVEAQSEIVFAGMKEIGARIRALAPDVLVVVSSDHLNNFRLGQPVPVGVAVDAVLTPLGDMGLPRDPIRGHAAFTTGFASFARKGACAEVVPLEGVQPDHGIMIPLGIVDPERQFAVAPVYVNTVFDDAPEPAQSYALGGRLKTYIETVRPADERVVILAGGGLSHWLGVPEEGRVNVDWDNAFVDLMIGGDHAALAEMTNLEIGQEAGNGGLEVNAWIVLAGAMPGNRGELVFYEPIPQWASGMGGLALSPDI
ncbi:hypothetical protein [Brevundimonas sp.]|uniref:DODA-type extradiol aromatic ring-opening family dioxygenase n=1 Tax=Brevundimonas sp. TaxID=1871086 RepID=UPI003BAA4763